MPTEPGLRDRKKALTRQRIADAAAALIAERGYDAVSMTEVARAADISEQTLYNYFGAKQDLVLDRAEQIRDGYARAVLERGAGKSPARALEPMLIADIERFSGADYAQARGEFLAQAVESTVLRRFVLEERERQIGAIADAIMTTSPGLPSILAHAHAASLVAVIQQLHDRIGSSILERADRVTTTDRLLRVADVAVRGLDIAFEHLMTTSQ